MNNILGTLLISITVISFLITFFYGLYLTFQNDGKKLNLIESISENKYFGFSILSTVVLFVIIFTSASKSEKHERNELVNYVKNINLETDKVYINGTLIKNDSLLIEFKNIGEESTGRNTGEVEINVKIIKNKRQKEILLIRDYQDARKYWVEIKLDETSKNFNCIGEINTKLLDTVGIIQK